MSESSKFYENKLAETRELVKKPDWYREFTKLRNLAFLGKAALSQIIHAEKNIIQRSRDMQYEIFEELLEENAVTLGKPGQSQPDELRKPIDKIIIHHTSRPPGMTKSYLSSMGLIRLYAPEYSKLPADDPEFGMPVYSGHFRDGKQVFWAYHWLIREDGKQESLLNDDEIGWHSGKWDTNTRSVAICIDDDLDAKRPNPEAVQSVANLIITKYSQVEPYQENILGHNEILKAKTPYPCPGPDFYKPKGWRRDLLSLIED